jgi:hypothetical protein
MATASGTTPRWTRWPSGIPKSWRGFGKDCRTAVSRSAKASTACTTYRATPTTSRRAKRRAATIDNVTTGGPWYRGVRNQCRPKIYTHNEGFYYYYLSFRCCAEADGKESDPRAPKQIKRGWEFERVEKLARFTREQMREKLELKKQGKCECGKEDTLCKTMCGTLLGPSAKDVQLGVPSATTP